MTVLLPFTILKSEKQSARHEIVVNSSYLLPWDLLLDSPVHAHTVTEDVR
jgi:hypothetical protein